jgi:hypothetical protein
VEADVAGRDDGVSLGDERVDWVVGNFH